MNTRRALALASAAAPVAYAVARALVAARVRQFETLDADTANLPGERLYVRGRRVHVLVEGEGPPLLMIHGFGASSVAFRRVAPLLRGHRRLIAADLPGFGYSERSPETDYSYTAQAGLMLEVLDRLGVQRVAVLGHSIGAAIALEMAVCAPERVDALVLAGGPGRGEAIVPAPLRSLTPLIAPLLAESRGAVRWMTAAAMARGRDVDEGLVDDLYAPARVQGHAAAFVAMLNGTENGPPPDLTRIAVPTLVMTGAADRYLTPAAARALFDALPNARLAIIEDAGHLLLDEQPERCADEILTLLALASTGTSPQPAPHRIVVRSSVPGDA